MGLERPLGVVFDELAMLEMKESPGHARLWRKPMEPMARLAHLMSHPDFGCRERILRATVLRARAPLFLRKDLHR